MTLRQLLVKEALTWGIETQVATTLDEAEKLLNSGQCNVMLLDLNFYDSEPTGLQFLATLNRQHPSLPAIILTAEESFEKRIEAARWGNHYFLVKPVVPSQILAVVTQTLRQASESSAKILIVDDDSSLLKLLSTLLTPSGYQLTLLSEPQQFWEILEQSEPDLLILDIKFSKPASSDQEKERSSFFNGIELCQVIRNDLRWNRLPVILLSVHTDLETVQRGFMAGADDFLSKPVVASELLIRVRSRLKQRKMWKIIEYDELTGVSLRRKALEDLTRAIHLAQRQGQPFCLAILDLDHFKRVNDQYGHETGDLVLSYFGQLLNKSFRSQDIIGRWGGEEFVVGMIGMTKLEGSKRLENILEKLNNYLFVAANGTSFRVTFSGGIAQLRENGNELQMLYTAADQALYQAKEAGRRRIIAAEKSQPNN